MTVDAVKASLRRAWLPLRAPRRRVGYWSALALCLALAVAAVAAGSAAARTHASRGVPTYKTPKTLPLRTSLFDPPTFSGSQKATAFTMAHDAGAKYVRILANWRSIAPVSLPLGFVASNPASPGYTWTALDNIVTAAEAAGLTPMLDVGGSPAWALASGSGAWAPVTPTTTALGDFATAIATHFDGKHGAPAVHVFQAWNEPNVSLYLAPVSPTAYRDMVNAFAASVHSVSKANIVVAGGEDPFGHPPRKDQNWYSVSPLAFMRSLLCLSKGSHPHATCHNPVHFDAWSHHPYTFGGPFGHAKHKNDVSLGDLPKMERLLKAAVRLHHVVSAHKVQFWVDEFSWDTNPPRKGAASLALAGRWTEESLYQMWKSGVSLATWFELEDQPSPSPYQCGLFFLSSSLATAKAKPVRTAFRFPFVAYRSKKSITVWGRDATSGKAVVTIERGSGHGHWQVVAKVRANKYGIFSASLAVKATSKDWLRAVAPGSSSSLAFALKAPKTPHIGPWGK